MEAFICFKNEYLHSLIKDVQFPLPFFLKLLFRI